MQEWVPGGELFHHLDLEGAFDEPTAQFYAASVLLALEFLHDRGFVYRDLKPENLLLARRPRPRAPPSRAARRAARSPAGWVGWAPAGGWRVGGTRWPLWPGPHSRSSAPSVRRPLSSLQYSSSD